MFFSWGCFDFDALFLIQSLLPENSFEVCYNITAVDETMNGKIAESLGSVEMSTSSSNLTQNGNVRNNDTLFTTNEIEEDEFKRLLDRPRPLNMERQRSFDERSLGDLAIGFSPRLSSRVSSENFARLIDSFDQTPSPGRKSEFNTPRSQNGFEQHPMVAEAWEALRRSLVYFRGQPVGTIAALDSTEENLNYDQVRTLYE